MTLVQSLENFNRKERYWLFQHAIGNHPLSEKFRFDLYKLLNPPEIKLVTVKSVEIPAEAYWAIDYHFDWIAGAITEFAGLASQFPNAPFKQEEGKSKLILGNQEDIDLLIAFEHTLILVEYKAGGNWYGQLKSKKRRLCLLKKLIESHVREQTIDVHFVTVCPKDKQKNEKLWLPLEYDEK